METQLSTAFLPPQQVQGEVVARRTTQKPACTCRALPRVMLWESEAICLFTEGPLCKFFGTGALFLGHIRSCHRQETCIPLLASIHKETCRVGGQEGGFLFQTQKVPLKAFWECGGCCMSQPYPSGSLVHSKCSVGTGSMGVCHH